MGKNKSAQTKATTSSKKNKSTGKTTAKITNLSITSTVNLPALHPNMIRNPLQIPKIGQTIKKFKQTNTDEVKPIQQKSDYLSVTKIVQPLPSVPSTNKSNTGRFHLSKEISISLVKKNVQPTNQNPKDVANILANRGVTITEIDKQNNSSTSNALTTDVCSIIDLTNDNETMQPKQLQLMISCHVKDCNEQFLTQQGLNEHKLRGHHSSDSVELGLPIVDLRNDVTQQKLASLGIVTYLPLSNFNKTTDGLYGLPIVSVQGNGATNNSAICNLSADGFLSLGPVKQTPHS